jgi:hypothetical protein
MNRKPTVRDALRRAEQGVELDASRLVARVPDMLSEARRIRARAYADPPTLQQLAMRALPRLAAATAVAVIVAASFALWERSNDAAASPTFESVILGGETADDDVFDALFGLEGNDG